MKTVIKASDLIQTLKNAKTIGTAKNFLTELQSLRDSFIESQGKKMLMIEIDTDEDFSIEEKMIGGIYVGKIFIEENESEHSALLRYIDALKINVNEYNKKKVEYFIEMIKSDDFRECLNADGEISAGGNQNITVYPAPVSNIILLEDISINLSE
ncbi:TPA: hypothetical protein NV714_004642 [Escherichia coli]|jgi:hypothetical protein|nr:hypothetical protein [Escherichia coli]